MAQKISIDILFNAINRAGNAFGSINGQVNKLESRVQNFNTKVGNLFSIGSIIGVGAGAGFLKLGADMEQNNVAFRVMMGSAEKARDVLGKLNNFANVTPFSNKEVIQSGRNLIAFGIEANKLESTMQRVGDVASGVRMPFTELAEIYGKIKVGNTVYNEDLNQLAGRGIPIFTELAKVMKVPESQIKKLSSEGKISFKEIDQAFINMTSSGGKYAGMMEEMSKTGAGAWSTAVGKLTDGVTRLSVSVMPVMTRIINGMMPVIDQFTALTQAHPELMKNILMVGGGLLALNVAGKVFGVMRAGALVATSGILQPIAGVTKLIKVTRLLNAALAAGRLTTYSALIERYGMAGRIAAGGIWVKNQAVAFGAFVGKLLNTTTRTAMILQLRQTIASKAQAAWTWVVTKSQLVASGVTSLWGKRMMATGAIQSGWNGLMAVTGMALKGLWTSFTGVIAQTWAWTAALWANPITWIVAGVIALVAGIALAWKYFDGFRGVLVGAWEGMKKFGEVLFGSVLGGLKQLLAGIGKVGKAIALLFKGQFKEAGKTALEGFGDIGKGAIKMSPVGVAVQTINRRDEIVNAAAQGYQKGKGMDTSNFLNFGSKKNHPEQEKIHPVRQSQTPLQRRGISAADLQNAGQPTPFEVWRNPGIDHPGLRNPQDKNHPVRQSRTPLQGRGMPDRQMPGMDMMKVPGMLNMATPEMGAMKVPGMLNMATPEMGAMKVPGMLNMATPEMGAMNVPGMLNMQKPGMDMMNVPGMLNMATPEMGAMKVPGMLNMQPPVFDAVTLTGKVVNLSMMSPKPVTVPGMLDLQGMNHPGQEKNHPVRQSRTPLQGRGIEHPGLQAPLQGRGIEEVTKKITQNIANNTTNNQDTRNSSQNKIEINYQPQVYVSANLTKESQDSLMKLLYADKDRLVKLINEEQRKDRRLNYAG